MSLIAERGCEICLQGAVTPPSHVYFSIDVHNFRAIIWVEDVNLVIDPEELKSLASVWNSTTTTLLLYMHMFLF